MLVYSYFKTNLNFFVWYHLQTDLNQAGQPSLPPLVGSVKGMATAGRLELVMLEEISSASCGCNLACHILLNLE
jgi:hypothetical protein